MMLDMLDNLESIKEMFDEASIDEQNRFLFKVLMGLRDEMRKGFDGVNTSIGEMKNACDCRKGNCLEAFVTKKQSRIFGIMVALFAAGLGIGTGVITWLELAKAIK
jgi:hypothetical protein